MATVVLTAKVAMELFTNTAEEKGSTTRTLRNAFLDNRFGLGSIAEGTTNALTLGGFSAFKQITGKDKEIERLRSSRKNELFVQQKRIDMLKEIEAGAKKANAALALSLIHI